MRRSGGCGRNWCCRGCERRLRWISGGSRMAQNPHIPNSIIPKRLLNARAFIMPAGPFQRPYYTNVHTGRMSQTSIERLRDYLAQLPPQAQALLMRKFELAIERGEDATIANLVLEQLRKLVRGTEEDEDAQPRTDDPARLLFRP